MSWGELFDRASEYEVTVGDVRSEHERRREAADDSASESGDEASESGEQS